MKQVVRGTEVSVKDVRFKDETGTTTLAIWGDTVENVKKGDSLVVRSCRVRVFGERKKLSTTPDSSVEVCTCYLKGVFHDRCNLDIFLHTRLNNCSDIIALPFK